MGINRILTSTSACGWLILRTYMHAYGNSEIPTHLAAHWWAPQTQSRVFAF